LARTFTPPITSDPYFSVPMKNGREKIGSSNIDWKSVAFGAGKNKRKTFGFGSYDKKSKEYEEEIHIKELSIVDGGIGCATWDASIILSRWIRKNSGLFTDKRVIELGAGTGLPGIYASKFCKECILTDYLENVIENLSYNINLNERGTNCRAKMLDWTTWDKSSKLGTCDILIGSELTYTGDLTIIKALCNVIDGCLQSGGIFVEVLSDDRDGVDVFLKEFASYGFSLEIQGVEEFMGNFGTKQKDETYKLYLFKK
jgi:predicted nicotinamide N-methyase